MDEFGYTYHAGAAELIKRRTSIIGLVIPSVVSSAFFETILAVQEAALELGMSLILGSAEYNVDQEEAILRQFLARRVAERRRGYEEALAERGIPADARYVRSTIPNINNGELAAMELLNASPRPTAVFAASDVLAIGCPSAARKAGLSVPRDLSVVGFDGIDFSAHTNPPLTTIAVPEKEMSRMAIHLLKQLINKEITPPKSYCLDTELIVRKSCAPPAQGGK